MVDLARLLALSSKFPNEALTLQEVSELVALAKRAAEELKEWRDRPYTQMARQAVSLGMLRQGDHK